MDSKSGKIVMAVGGIAAVGAALWWIWKKYIDFEDEEDDVEPVVLLWFCDSQKPLVKEDKQEDIPNLRIAMARLLIF